MRSLIIGRAIIQTSLRGIAAATILLLIAPALATAQDSSLSADMHVEHMFNRAESGYLQNKIKMPRAYQLVKEVPHDPAEAAQWLLDTANVCTLGATSQTRVVYR